MKRLCITLFAGAVLLTALSALAATLYFKSGARFEGEVLEVTGTNSVVARSDKDGVAYTINLDYLTDESRLYAARSRDPRGYEAAVKAEKEKAEARKALPEEPPDSASDSDQIVGAFGVKLGQTFDAVYALSTNKTSEAVIVNGERFDIELKCYRFRPRQLVPPFVPYFVSVNSSNVVYSITTRTAGTHETEGLAQERDRLLSILQRKYGRATRQSEDSEHTIYTITQGTREVTLYCSFRRSGYADLYLTYQDSRLAQQARSEQVNIQLKDPARGAERQRLKQQL